MEGLRHGIIQRDNGSVALAVSLLLVAAPAVELQKDGKQEAA
jgi:hypothetical protein